MKYVLYFSVERKKKIIMIHDLFSIKHKKKILKYKYNRSKDLTLRGKFWTISTASWLLMCSHRPSDANITNWSCGQILCVTTDGSANRIGLENDSGRRNFPIRGSLLNSAFFKYASPIDRDTCKKEDYETKAKNTTSWMK